METHPLKGISVQQFTVIFKPPKWNNLPSDTRLNSAFLSQLSNHQSSVFILKETSETFFNSERLCFCLLLCMRCPAPCRAQELRVDSGPQWTLSSGTGLVGQRRRAEGRTGSWCCITVTQNSQCPGWNCAQASGPV